MYIIPLLSCLHHQHRQYRYVHLHQVDIVSTLCNLFLLIHIVNVTILTNIKSTLRFAFYEWCKRNSIPYTDYLFKNSITEACEHFFTICREVYVCHEWYCEKNKLWMLKSEKCIIMIRPVS